ncbi:hypothetical protein L1987_05887 [Smallanthus sonchifolius]|uniref:Uncharacterized protein n=1 Tax=Smallanthus sonchifolius TaxID=185202 RepID=A0ACB9JWN0_9ASTR|nr:hypothetical protein L1987_05887 [Smallanthus sonchifolius]
MMMGQGRYLGSIEDSERTKKKAAEQTVFWVTGCVNCDPELRRWATAGSYSSSSSALMVKLGISRWKDGDESVMGLVGGDMDGEENKMCCRDPNL